MERNRQRAAVVTLAVAYAVAFGCGGGGGDDTPVAPTTCVSFAPAADPGAVSQVTTAVGASACSTVTVVVRAQSILDVFNVSFDVVYNTSVVRFDRDSFNGGSTSFLTTNAGSRPAGCLAEERSTPSPRVVVSCQIFGAGPGVNFPVNPEEVVRLPFRKVASTGSSGFSFESNFIFDSSSDPVTDPPISGVTWSDGGTFTIR